MRDFIFDVNPKSGDQEMIKGDTTYRLKTGIDGVTFHVLNKDVNDSIDLSFIDLKALFQLCSTEKK